MPDYFTLTGNPFVDAGIFVLSELLNKNIEEITPEDLKEPINTILSLYLSDPWRKNLYSIFPNNPITNPSIKNKKVYFLKKMGILLDSFALLKNTGSCIACGRREIDQPKTKDEIPLTGSGDLVNFFPAGQAGENYCSVCTFAVQFMPLFLYNLGGKFLLLHSPSFKVMKVWTRQGIKNAREQLVSGVFTGCFDDGYKRGDNALFHIIEDVVLSYEEKWMEENSSVSAYIFTNYGQNPALEIIYLPADVFKFLVYVKAHKAYSEWKKVVKKGYSSLQNEEEFKWKPNRVYRRLLEDSTIVPYFLNQDRTVIGGWEILTFYLMEVRKMENKRIETIKRVSDKMAKIIRLKDNTKRLFKIERANSYESLRGVFLNLVKDNITLRSSEPLLTLDELTQDLFPEGAYGWKEIRDIILFRLYEVLHDYLIAKKELPELEEIEEEEE